MKTIYGFTDKLKCLRKIEGLSPENVAEILNISESTIYQYESGACLPSIQILLALAKLYHTSTDYLLGLDDTTYLYADLTPKEKEFITNFNESIIEYLKNDTL